MINSIFITYVTWLFNKGVNKINSFGSPVVYLISRASFLCQYSILLSPTSFNIVLKFLKFNGFPSYTSISTTGATAVLTVDTRHLKLQLSFVNHHMPHLLLLVCNSSAPLISLNMFSLLTSMLSKVRLIISNIPFHCS